MLRAGSLYGFLLIALNSSAVGAPIISDVRIALERRGDEAVVTIRNNPNEPTAIATPLVEWQPGTTGIEFKVWSREGNAVIECVMRDYPPSFQKQYELKPSEKISKSFKIEQIGKDFCMKSGRYFLQAIFHNEIAENTIIKDVFSNPIEIDLGEHKAR